MLWCFHKLPTLEAAEMQKHGTELQLEAEFNRTYLTNKGKMIQVLQ